MYLYPCALIDDFTFGQLSSTITTEVANKWSTTDAEATPSLDDVKTKVNKRSLKIAYSATASRRYITRGVDGTAYTALTWNNPFGVAINDDVSDASWADTFGYWIYTDTDVYTDDNDLLKFTYETTDNDGTASVNWPDNVDTTDQWIWADQSIDMQYDGIDRFRFGVDHAGTGNIYLNSPMVFKKSTSHVSVTDSTDSGADTTAATGSFDWTNGIGLVVTGITRTYTGYSVTCFVDPKYYKECIDQLLNMRTFGIIKHAITRGGYSKISAIRDLGYLKTYLFYGEFNGPTDSDHYEMISDPVVISSVNINHVSGKPHIPQITLELVKYTGV